MSAVSVVEGLFSALLSEHLDGIVDIDLKTSSITDERVFLADHGGMLVLALSRFPPIPDE